MTVGLNIVGNILDNQQNIIVAITHFNVEMLHICLKNET